VNTATETLSEFVADLEFDDIPDDVVAHVRRIVQNIVAATLWGWRSAGGPQIRQVMAALGGSPDVGIWGTALRLPVAHAAAVHAGAAFASKSDDTHGPAQLHPGHAVVPTVLAYAERGGATGRECVSAIAAAIEAGVRVADAVGPSQDLEHNSMRMGFWSESKCSIVAAFAGARVAGLAPELLSHAIGIAATSSSGLLTSAGYGRPPHALSAGSVYAWDAGKAVLLGCLAVDLAAAGMTAGPAPLEGPRGWVRTFTGGHGSIESLTDGLGEVWETRNVALKTHCMSHTIFPTIDAAKDLVRELGIDVDEVSRVVIHGPDYIGDNFWRTEIRTFEDGACSAPYAVAVGMVDSAPQTTADSMIGFIGDPRVARLVAICEFEPDPLIPMNSGQLPGAITVELADGRTVRRDSAPAARGSWPDYPVPDKQIDAKLLGAAGHVLSDAATRDVLELLRSFDELDDVRTLTRALVGCST
jgi:2-methylcitrate dehydratase PrpD